MITGYLFFFIFLVLSLYFIIGTNLFKIDGWTKTPVLIAYACKVVFAVSVWFIYSYYYNDRPNSDIFKYFDDAVHIFNETEDSFLLRLKAFADSDDSGSLKVIYEGTHFWDSQEEIWFNDNRTMTRIHLILLHFSNGFYHLHTLFFAFLSLIGSMGVFRFFKYFSTIPVKIIFGICFFVPSVLFWASAPLKESVLLFSIGLTLWGITEVKRKNSAAAILLFVFGILSMLSLKLYILASAIPGLLFMITSNRNTPSKNLMKFLIIHVGVLLLFIVFSEELTALLSSKQSAFKELAISSDAKSTIPLRSFRNLPELLYTIPQALFNTLIRPIYPPKWGLFTLMASLEHLFYISVLTLPLFFLKKAKNLMLPLFCFSFVFIALVVIGLTTPILGAIVRYKAPLIPFYLILIFTFVDLSKLPHRLQ